MHKAVLEVKGLSQLESLSARLIEAGITHKVWVEQPEGISTAIATKPARKSVLSAHFKKGCSLCSWHIPKAPKETVPELGS
jgi:hypothetical protein